MKLAEILIVGIGGVGGYFGFKLAQKYSGGEAAKITFVARAATYEVVKEKGLTLLSSEHADRIAHPNKIFRSISETDYADLIIFCVKEYDLDNVCAALKKKVTKDTVLLPLMNGVDIYERIRRVFSHGVIIPACVYVASHIKEKGVIEHQGNPGKIILGKDPNNAHFNPQQIVKLLKDAGIDVEYKEHPFPDIWTKFIFIASFGLVSARYDKSIGQVNEDPVLNKRATLIMREIENIARVKVVELQIYIEINKMLRGN